MGAENSALADFSIIAISARQAHKKAGRKQARPFAENKR